MVILGILRNTYSNFKLVPLYSPVMINSMLIFAVFESLLKTVPLWFCLCFLPAPDSLVQRLIPSGRRQEVLNMDMCVCLKLTRVTHTVSAVWTEKVEKWPAAPETVRNKKNWRGSKQEYDIIDENNLKFLSIFQGMSLHA